MEKAVTKIAKANSFYNLRFERKFIYEHLTLEDLIQTEVLTNPFCFEEIFQRRSVNNIYFDDFNLSFYKQNVSGDGLREKYRLRWYGDTFSAITKPTFEIKKKFGEAGDKYSFKMKETSLSLENSNAQEIQQNLEDIIKAQGNLELAHKISTVSPALFNSYERRYFLSNCGKYRITLDYNMRFFNPNVADYQSTMVAASDIVLELKYDTPFDDESRELTQYLGARLSKNSKYVRGVDAFYR